MKRIALLIVVLLAACSNSNKTATITTSTTNLKQAVQQWQQSIALNTKMQELAYDSDSIVGAINNNSSSDLLTACKQLATDATALNNANAAPDRDLTTYLVELSEYFVQAATHCLRGQYNQINSNITNATQAITLLKQRLDTING